MASSSHSGAAHLVVTDEMKDAAIWDIGKVVRAFFARHSGFTSAECNAVGITHDLLVKMPKVFTMIKDAGTCQWLVDEAVHQKVIETGGMVTPKSLVQLCRWIKSPAGRQALDKEKLMRKYPAGTEVVLAAHAELLRQFNDMAVELKIVRALSEAKINELRRQIKLEEAKLKALDTEFPAFAPTQDDLS